MGYSKIRYLGSTVHLYEFNQATHHFTLEFGIKGKFEKLSNMAPNSVAKINCGVFGGTAANSENYGTWSNNWTTVCYDENDAQVLKFYDPETMDIKIFNTITKENTLVFGAGYTLIENSKISIRNFESFPDYKQRHPRTMLAQRTNRNMLFIVIDGRRWPSELGMTAAEQAKLCMYLKVRCAVNLDGGGSSEMVVGDKIMNRPSGNGERLIGTCLSITRSDMGTLLNPNNYITENQIEKLLTFNTLDSRQISLVLARRIAAWLRDNCLRSLATYGYRPDETQAKLYAAWIAYRNYRDNPLKYPKAPFANPAAPPGASWHNYGFADDLQGQLVQKLVENTILNYPRSQQPCNKYGICFPMNKHDAPTQLEWWHVVPIETIGYIGDRSKFVAPEEAIYTQPPTIKEGNQSIWVSEFMRLTDTSFNESAIKHWQASHRLVADGIIGPNSWKIAYKLKNVII